MLKNIIHRPEIKTVMMHDSRFYSIDSINYYPSCTTVLEASPTPAGLKLWYKQLGMQAERVMEEAQRKGKRIHDAISNLIIGHELVFTDYVFDEWQHICRFVDFFNQHKPHIIHTEYSMVCEELKMGGTLDILCYIGEDLWLIDIKTGKEVYDTHFLQLAAYSKMWDIERPDRPVDRIGILHTSASTKGPDKKGLVMQGEGWKIHEPEEPFEELWDTFCDIRRIWDRKNKDYKVKIISLPDTLKLVI